MYTIVLMAALSTAPDGPQFNGLFRNSGSGCTGTTAASNGSCYGTCSGSCYGSCTGSSYACYGSCHGSSCQGGGFGSRIRAFFNRNNSCYGSCHGQSTGCTGSGYSCSGYSCQGGGTFAPVPGGSFPGGSFPPPPMGGEFAPPTSTSFIVPSDGCQTCGVPLGTPTPVAAGYGYPVRPTPFPPVPMTAPTVVPTAAPPVSPTVEESRTSARTTSGGPNRATVIVRLPADAKLFAEGRPLALESAERSFVSPVLPVGREFEYTFRAEYVRDGETISQAKKVTVRAGGTQTVEFADLTRRAPAAETKVEPPKVELTGRTAGVVPPANNPFLGGGATVPQVPAGRPATAERARITVKVPAGVTLYVDDKRNDRTDPTREFTTPPLPPGQDFAYVMKAERTRDGRPETQTQKITFRAGEIVTVDFTSWPTR